MDANSPLTNEAAKKAHPAESGHWYSKDGQQVPFTKGSKGQDVRTTLAHARKLQLAPGVTTILAVPHKPQLELWKIRQGILAALTLPRGETESEGDWMRRVEEDMRQTAAKAAEEGTRIHAAIQEAIAGNEPPPQYLPHVEGVMAEIDKCCGLQAWRSEVACVSRWGFGTKSDLCSDDWILDFKGKDGSAGDLAKLETYDEHAQQLAATEEALGGGTTLRKCGIVFVSRTHPGVARLVAVPAPELERGGAMFRTLLTYWQLKNNYRPDWAIAAGAA